MSGYCKSFIIFNDTLNYDSLSRKIRCMKEENHEGQCCGWLHPHTKDPIKMQMKRYWVKKKNGSDEE